MAPLSRSTRMTCRPRAANVERSRVAAHDRGSGRLVQRGLDRRHQAASARRLSMRLLAVSLYSRQHRPPFPTRREWWIDDRQYQLAAVRFNIVGQGFTLHLIRVLVKDGV
jgi:hypothetical protein